MPQIGAVVLHRLDGDRHLLSDPTMRCRFFKALFDGFSLAVGRGATMSRDLGPKIPAKQAGWGVVDG